MTKARDLAEHAGHTYEDQLGDAFRDFRQESKDRRAANRAASPERLTEAGIAFTVHNAGAHLIVAVEWDFWPGTGKWCHRGPPLENGRGVANLIQRIKETP